MAFNVQNTFAKEGFDVDDVQYVDRHSDPYQSCLGESSDMDTDRDNLDFTPVNRRHKKRKPSRSPYENEQSYRESLMLGALRDTVKKAPSFQYHKPTKHPEGCTLTLEHLIRTVSSGDGGRA